mgnify:CR=1 FL=1|tara:strand:- start:951 stop:1949 length:999 start_codon:yes stop_codon:yes gene_type:complete
MAVPSSGQLKLYADIQNEAGGAQANSSLHGLSIYAGFSSPDAMSDFYGWADIELGAVTTNSITSIGSSTMRLNGNLTSTGFDTSVQVGFHQGTSTDRASNPTYSAGTKSTTGTFLVDRGGLSYGTNYYAWAYATNDAGTVYGSRADATTTFPPFTPVLKRTQCFGSNAYYNNAHPSQLSKFEAGYINPYSGVATAVLSLVCQSPSTCSGGCGRQLCYINNTNTQVAMNARSYYCHYMETGENGCGTALGFVAYNGTSFFNGYDTPTCYDQQVPSRAIEYTGTKTPPYPNFNNNSKTAPSCFYISTGAPGSPAWPGAANTSGWRGSFCVTPSL